MNPRWELGIALFCVVVAAAVVSSLSGPDWRRRTAAFLAAWLVPGAGHAVMGKWKKGLFLFALLGLTYVAGLWIVGWKAVSFEDNPFYYVGQYGSGLTFLLARVISPDKAFPRDGLPPSWFDPGLLYVCVVGLLNLVLMLNVLDLRVPRGSRPAPAPAPPPAAPERPAGAA